jgi:hypothetical protein
MSEKVEQIMILYQILKFKMTNLSTRSICRPAIQRRIRDKVPITSNNDLFKQGFRLARIGQVSCNKALTIMSNSRSVNSKTRILRFLPNIVHPCIASFRIIVSCLARILTGIKKRMAVPAQWGDPRLEKPEVTPSDFSILGISSAL